MMEWYAAGALMIGLVLALMLLRLPIGFAFLAADLVGVIVFLGGKFGIVQLIANTTTAITGFALVPLPLFILMGEIFFHTGVASRVFTVFDHLLGNVKGRLAFVAIGGGTMFAALSGSSIANVAMMGSTSYPEMKRRGYSTYLSVGPIVATGSLAALIPPSGLAVLLGSLAGIDIGRLLLGGVVPGLILSALYCVVVFTWVRMDPDSAPPYPVDSIGWAEKFKLVVTDLAPMAVVVFMVIGLIILGIATPTESAAFGVVGVVIVAALFRKLTFAAFMKSVSGTLRVTGMVLFIILASTTFSQILALSGATRGLIAWIISLNAGPI
jgi:tripartite ATP-independent transporter DctM subunit